MPSSKRPYYLGLLGSNIQNSLSPAIHEAFAQQFDLQIHYQLIDFSWPAWGEKWEAIQQLGYHGLNVTAPFKEKIVPCLHQLSGEAKAAGAVNTVLFSDTKSLGHNTDGQGLLEHFHALGWALKGKRICILGAGGVVRGVLGPLLDHEPDLIHIANRDPNRLERLAESAPTSGRITYSNYEALPQLPFDIVIHATSAKTPETLPPLEDLKLAAGVCCYDMNYHNDITAFLHWAQAQGCTHLSDGMGMLIAQAAASFYLWFGKKPRIASL